MFGNLAGIIGSLATMGVRRFWFCICLYWYILRLNLIDVYLLLLLTLKQTIGYMFPIYIFVSIVPILVSVDYFDGMARNTGAEKAQSDAKVCLFSIVHKLCNGNTLWFQANNGLNLQHSRHILCLFVELLQFTNKLLCALDSPTPRSWVRFPVLSIAATLYGHLMLENG